MFVLEAYTPLSLTANAVQSVSSSSCTIGGFNPTVSGTLTLRAGGASGDVVVNAYPVTAGAFAPLPYVMPIGAHITLAGGAAGTLAWNPK